MTIIFDLVILLWKPSHGTILNIAKTLYIIIIVYSVLDTLLNVLNALLFNGYTKAYDIWLFFFHFTNYFTVSERWHSNAQTYTFCQQWNKDSNPGHLDVKTVLINTISFVPEDHYYSIDFYRSKLETAYLSRNRKRVT